MQNRNRQKFTKMHLDGYVEEENLKLINSKQNALTRIPTEKSSIAHNMDNYDEVSSQQTDTIDIHNDMQFEELKAKYEQLKAQQEMSNSATQDDKSGFDAKRTALTEDKTQFNRLKIQNTTVGVTQNKFEISERSMQIVGGTGSRFVDSSLSQRSQGRNHAKMAVQRDSDQILPSRGKQDNALTVSAISAASAAAASNESHRRREQAIKEKIDNIGRKFAADKTELIETAPTQQPKQQFKQQSPKTPQQPQPAPEQIFHGQALRELELLESQYLQPGNDREPQLQKHVLQAQNCVIGLLSQKVDDLELRMQSQEKSNNIYDEMQLLKKNEQATTLKLMDERVKELNKIVVDTNKKYEESFGNFSEKFRNDIDDLLMNRDSQQDQMQEALQALEKRLGAKIHSQTDSFKQSLQQISSKLTDAIRMRVEVQRMETDKQMHEMCSMVESIASLQRKFEANFERRINSFDKLIAEQDKRLGDKMQKSEQAMAQEFEQIKRRHYELTELYQTQLESESQSIKFGRELRSFQNNEEESQAESMKEAPLRKTDFNINVLNSDIPHTENASAKQSPINKIQKPTDKPMALNMGIMSEQNEESKMGPQAAAIDGWHSPKFSFEKTQQPRMQGHQMHALSQSKSQKNHPGSGQDQQASRSREKLQMQNQRIEQNSNKHEITQFARSAYFQVTNVNSMRGGLESLSRGGVSSGTGVRDNTSTASRRRLGIKGKRKPTTSTMRIANSNSKE